MKPNAAVPTHSKRRVHVGLIRGFVNATCDPQAVLLEKGLAVAIAARADVEAARRSDAESHHRALQALTQDSAREVTQARQCLEEARLSSQRCLEHAVAEANRRGSDKLHAESLARQRGEAELQRQIAEEQRTRQRAVDELRAEVESERQRAREMEQRAVKSELHGVDLERRHASEREAWQHHSRCMEEEIASERENHLRTTASLAGETSKVERAVELVRKSKASAALTVATAQEWAQASRRLNRLEVGVLGIRR